MTLTKKPFWVAWNVWVSLVILLGGYLLGTLHQDKPSYYCQQAHCVRVLPGEDAQSVYLEQIITERRLIKR